MNESNNNRPGFMVLAIVTLAMCVFWLALLSLGGPSLEDIPPDGVPVVVG